ncbi:ABC transporter ATP-binding protein [Burkholderia plantarii]|uniref:ABC transporter ATP-binding protein n=1 Tax=Burkholderia plantarii TaxID=41899 RepID=UPI0006D88B43|nr:ABC transporter ATP-binding protein [Burkholderia plantarii]ALK32423.1 aliphatic sulfonates import ATP-binding protein SsuB 2 [Burkholderia plantarii]GLZ18971.1 aliphatic sulfonates import ATP-binding protein SsuB 2 [Burkholderia plantarii]
MSAAPLLDARGVRKRYGDRVVLAGVDLRVGRGEIVCVVGPSGCGKSTLLRIVAGLDADHHGSVRLDGAPLHGPSARIGVIFQEPRLLPWLSVADNVGFAAGARGGRSPQVAQLLAEVGLDGAAHALPAALSGGMAQRAAIARGLFGEPDLLLLDEPFSAVDALTRMRLQTLLLDVVRRRATAAVVVTHDLDEALYLGDRVLLLAANPGRVEDAFPVEIARPRDRRDPALAALRARLLGAFQRFQEIDAAAAR